MDLMYCSVSQILACDFSALVKAKAKLKPISKVALIHYPCLVNTVVFEPGSELILKWEQKGEKGPIKHARGRNAFDQLHAAENKAKKATQDNSKEA